MLQVGSLIDDEHKAAAAADPKAFAMRTVSIDSSLSVSKKLTAAE